MPRATHFQSNFTAGEISPRLRGRSDLSRFQNGLETASNCIVFPQGMISRRPGTKFVARTKGDTASRLMPFRFNDSEAYTVEIGYYGSDSYLRFYRDEIQIQAATSVMGTARTLSTASWTSGVITYTTSAAHRLGVGDEVTITGVSPSQYNITGNVATVGSSTTFTVLLASDPGTYSSGGDVNGPYDIAGPWKSQADIDEIGYIQSADELYLCHKQYIPRILQRTGADIFQVAVLNYHGGPHEVIPRTAGLTIMVSAHDARIVTGRPGTAKDQYSGDEVGEHCMLRLSTSDFSWSSTRDIGRIVKARIASGDFGTYMIYEVLSGRDAYAVTMDKGPVIATLGTAVEWYLGDWYGAGKSGYASQRSATAITVGGAVTTSSKHTLYAGDSVTISGTVASGTIAPIAGVGASWVSGEANYNVGAHTIEVGDILTATLYATYTAYNTTGAVTWVDATNVRIAMPVDPGGSDTGGQIDVEYDDGSKYDGTYTATITSSTVFSVTLGSTPRAAATSATVTCPDLPNSVVYEGTSGARFPSVPAFHQQRLWLANTESHPNRIYASATGDFTDFGPTALGSPFAPVATSGLTLTIDDDQVNEIFWMKAVAQGLIVGTVGAEYSIKGGSGDGVITPSEVRAIRQTQYGSKSGRSYEMAGRSLLFVHRGGERLYELNYSFDADQQVGVDLSIISDHILKSGVVETSYQELPAQIVWMTKGDGSIACLTFEKEQDVIGWTSCSMGGSGLAEAVCVTPEPSDDHVWFIVNRAGVRYVEVMQPPIDTDDDQIDAWYVDAGLKLDQRNTITDDYMTYIGSYVAGGTGLLTATGHTPFAGSSADIDKRFRLYDSNGNWYDFRVNAYDSGTSSTSVAMVELLTSNLPTELQSTATASWAQLVQTVSGLDYLEGQTLKCYADGGVQSDITVSGGIATLDDFTAVAIIGYGYTSTIKSLPIRVLQYFTDTRGKAQRIYNAELEVWRSLGGSADFGGVAMPIVYRTTGDVFGYPPSLKSQRIELSRPSSYSPEQQLTITTSDPVPFNLLAVVYELDINAQV